MVLRNTKWNRANDDDISSKYIHPTAGIKTQPDNRRDSKKWKTSSCLWYWIEFLFCIDIGFVRDIYLFVHRHRNTYKPIKQQVNTNFFYLIFITNAFSNLFDALIAIVVLYKLQRTNTFMISPFFCMSIRIKNKYFFFSFLTWNANIDLDASVYDWKLSDCKSAYFV